MFAGYTSLCLRKIIHLHIWRFPETGAPQNEWFLMEHPIKMDNLGVPPWIGNLHMLLHHCQPQLPHKESTILDPKGHTG